MAKEQYKPNEQRANVKNPNNKDYVADQINRANQQTDKVVRPPKEEKNPSAKRDNNS